MSDFGKERSVGVGSLRMKNGKKLLHVGHLIFLLGILSSCLDTVIYMCVVTSIRAVIMMCI